MGDIDAACEALRQLVALAFREGLSTKENAEKQMVIPRLSVPIPFYNNLDWSRCRNVDITLVPSVNENDKEKPTQANSMDHHKVVNFDMKKVKSVGMVLGNPKGILVTKILRLSFTHVIKACARAKNRKLAEQLFFQMQNLGIQPSRSAYDGLIRVLAQTGGLHDGMEVLKLMQQKNLKPLDLTLAALSISCSKGLELDLAEAFLNQMAKCERPYPYNALLKACDILDTPERGVRVFGKMKQLKVTPNIKTYELLFSLFGNVNAPYESGNILSQAEVAKRIRALEDDMMRNGIQHSYLSIRNLLHALGSEGMISRLLHYLRVAESQYPPRTPIYNIVLHSLVDAEEGNVAINVFKTLMSHGYRPNGVTLNIMIDCCTITRSFKSAQGLTAMSIRYGFPPDTLTYTSLIKAVLASGDFDEALTLLNHACSEGIQIDALLFNAILKEAAWKDRIDIIEFVMHRMLNEKVRPDAATCGYVFSKYVDRGFHNTAMEALQVMSICMLSEQDINENKTLFEDEFIYAEDSEVESRALEHFLDSEHHAVALLNLRWCAMQGNSISWSIHDSPWVKRLSATNRFR